MSSLAPEWMERPLREPEQSTPSGALMSSSQVVECFAELDAHRQAKPTATSTPTSTPTSAPFRRRIAGPSSLAPASGARKFGTAPLSQKLVGGLPINKPKTKSGPLNPEFARMQREINKETRNIARVQRQQTSRGSNTKHRERKRDEEWAVLRIRQVRRALTFFSRSDTYGTAENQILDNSMMVQAMRLCNLAAYQATDEAMSNKLDTGSAFSWAIPLVMEAWCRANGGDWVVESRRAAEVLSWAHMEDVYKQHMGDTTCMQEHHADAIKAEKHKAGVTRTVCSHSLGNHQQKLAKNRCLHELLVKAGDQGLHGDIVRMYPPTIIRELKPAMPSALAGAKQHAIANHSGFATAAVTAAPSFT